MQIKELERAFISKLFMLGTVLFKSVINYNNKTAASSYITFMNKVTSVYY